jgi:hypothetical protein
VFRVKRAGSINLFQKQFRVHVASSPVEAEASFLGDKACGKRFQVVFVKDRGKDFKIVYWKNVQSVGGLHLAARNSNKLQINKQREAHKLQFPSVCLEVSNETVALPAVGTSALC